MVAWRGPDHPIPEPIVWTERGLRIRNAVRWVIGVILFVAAVVAMTHHYGVL